MSAGHTYRSPFCLTAWKLGDTAALASAADESATVIDCFPFESELSTTRSPVTSVTGYVCATLAGAWAEGSARAAEPAARQSRSAKASRIATARPARRDVRPWCGM